MSYSYKPKTTGRSKKSETSSQSGRGRGSTSSTSSRRKEDGAGAVSRDRDDQKSRAQEPVQTNNDERQKILKLQHALSFGEEVKWLPHEAKGYMLVRVLQQKRKPYRYGDPDLPCVVLTATGDLFEVPDPKKLKDAPPCKNAEDLVSHINELRTMVQWPGVKVAGGAQIVLGKTECTFSTRWGTKQGVVMNVTDVYSDAFKATIHVTSWGSVYTYTTLSSQLTFLEAGGSANRQLKDEKKTTAALQKEIKTAQNMVSSLESELEKTRSSLSSTQRRLHSAQNSKEKKEEEYNRLMQEKRNAERLFDSKLKRMQTDISEKKREIDGLRDSCSKATSLRDEAKKKYERMLDDYNSLRKLRENYEEEKKQSQELVDTLRERLVEGSSLFDVSMGFPAVQDIVKDFDTVKSQPYEHAARSIRKALKSEYKDVSKLRISRKVAELLFAILLTAYQRVQDFQQIKMSEIAQAHGLQLDEDNKSHAATVQKMMRDTFAHIVNKVKKKAAEKVTAYCLQLHGMKDASVSSAGGRDTDLPVCLSSDVEEQIRRYAEECVVVCWVIVLSRDPGLVIKPAQFLPAKDDKIVFDEKYHIEGFNSEPGQRLNFVSWPAIYRVDTDKPISKVTAVFVNEIPQWSKKKLKELKKKREEKERKEKERAEREEQEKAERQQLKKKKEEQARKQFKAEQEKKKNAVDPNMDEVHKDAYHNEEGAGADGVDANEYGKGNKSTGYTGGSPDAGSDRDNDSWR